MKQLFILAHDTARQRAIDAVRSAPPGYSVTVSPPKRNTSQNALLHAVLTDVANQVDWAGSKRDVTTWKRLLTAGWLRAKGEHAELLPAIDGRGFEVLYQHTSELHAGECAELVDYIHAWGTERGVKWSGP